MRRAVIYLLASIAGCGEPLPEDTAPAPVGSLLTSVGVLDLGALPVGAQANARLDLRNDGDGPLEIWDVGFSDDAMRTHWVISGEISATLAPGTSETLLVTFQPQAIGNLGVALQILSDDPAARVREVTLRGQGVGTPGLYAAPDALDFGVVIIGEAAEAEVHIANYGDADLHIGEVTVSAGESEYFLALDPSASTLAPGAQNGLAVVRFEPHFDGTLYGTLTIASDDPATPTLLVSLVGEGDPPSAR
ncbi:MAG: choice-of-anchor D domain-containing protein [Pseudomonadota bacterium]